MRKLRLNIAALIAVACIVISGVFIYNTNSQTVSAGYESNTVIIIDPGHGGFDGGAVAPDGTVEKDINLGIANNLALMLKASGYDVIMTRTTDTGTEDDENTTIDRRKVSDLQNRLKLINSYEDAAFVSVHLNKFTTSSANGAQVFYSKNHARSSDLGQSIQESIVGTLQPENTRVIKQATKSTYLLHNAKIPAVIVECGFLSNAKELQKLKDENYQKQMSHAIFCGIINYLN